MANPARFDKASILRLAKKPQPHEIDRMLAPGDPVNLLE